MKRLRKFLSAAMFAAGACSLAAGESVLWSGALVAVSFVSWPWGRGRSDATQSIQNLEKQRNIEALGKARSDYAAIREGAEHIRDRGLAMQVEQLQSIAGKMLLYLSQHPQRIPAASRFIDYYQDRTASLIQQYLSLSQTGMHTEETDRLRQDMRKIFQGFVVAYEQEFSKVLNYEVMDMDAEMKVARQIMQGEGINCDELKITEPEPPQEEEKSKESFWNVKTAGLAVGAAVLGAVGLWKMFGEEKK